jgi:hypothetical protein
LEETKVVEEEKVPEQIQQPEATPVVAADVIPTIITELRKKIAELEATLDPIFASEEAYKQFENQLLETKDITQLIALLSKAHLRRLPYYQG